MKYSKLSIVVPVYNEENTLSNMVHKLMQVPFKIDTEVVMVNDASKDKSAVIMEELKKEFKSIKLLSNKKNVGKSQTVKKGILETTGDLVVIQDADLEYDPKELLDFVKIFEKENVDVVYGNRFGYSNEVVYFENWVGNTFLSGISSIFTGLRAGMWTRDMEVCYKMAKGALYRELVRDLKATSNFGFEPEITSKFSKVKGIKFKQIPVRYYPRTVSEGKKLHAWKDGVKALKEILRFNLKSK